MATTEPARARKGKKISQDEERQLCRSVLHVLQDPVVGNGQRATAFWERITKHYKENRPGGCAERPSRSLETKWGVIKHDVSKFCGVYKSILLLRESGTSAEDILDRALDLYKVRHPKQQPFVFVHCWRLLKDVPRWADVVCSAATPQPSVRSPTGMPKRRTVAQPPSSAAEVEAETGVADVDEVGDEELPKRPKRPQGSKSTKDELRLRQVKEVAIHAQARATADLVAANMRKAQVLQDQAALSLFTMPVDEGLSDEAHEYLSLRWQEKMSKLRRHLAEEKQDEARVAANASRLEQERTAELHRATRNRVRPAPLQPPPRTGIATTSLAAHSPFTSAGDGAGADGDDAAYNLPDNSQADSDHVILETECPSSDDLNFTPGVQGSHVSACRPSFEPDFMQTAVPPCFFPAVSRPGFFRGPFADA